MKELRVVIRDNALQVVWESTIPIPDLKHPFRVDLEIIDVNPVSSTRIEGWQTK